MPPKKSKRYWIDDPDLSLTRSQVRRAAKATRVKIAVAWFLRNFEDPANETPYESKEGGYQYIWGGPYDAADEIGNEFGSVLSDVDIESAVAKVQEDGIYDWAPVRRNEDYEQPEDSPILSYVPIGHPDEQERRQEALRRLHELNSIISDFGSNRPGLGHNNPPEPVDPVVELDADINQLHLHASQLSEEFSSEKPDAARIENNAGLFRKILDKLSTLGKKAVESKIADGIGGLAIYFGEKSGLFSLLLDKANAA
ncbi:hypothetical protein [Afipia sp. DC4300-2b1]|uniref:hypothetical protein n=1 Tax=Afipia sp. DC4300-2b1 TaxID=2804672 RepID=UPI003CE86C59